MTPSEVKISSTEGTIKRLKNRTANAKLIEGILVPIKFRWTSPPRQELIQNGNTNTANCYHDQLISTRLLLHVFRDKLMS